MKTLENKFGNLPIKYYKVNVNNKTELNLFEEALNKFNFNINVVEDDINKAEPLKKTKRPFQKMNVTDIIISDEEEEEEIDLPPPSLRKKTKLEEILTQDLL